MGTARKTDAAADALSGPEKGRLSRPAEPNDEWDLRRRALERWENEGGRLRREPPRDERWRGHRKWDRS